MSFGLGNSLFPSSSSPSLGFGTTPAAKPTGFATSFFNPPASSAPTFGLGSNTPTVGTSGGFTGFGTTPSNTGFGIGGFGTTAPSAGSSLGGFGTFGTSTTNTVTPGFGGLGSFGNTSTTGGFGTTSTAGSFGSTSTTGGFGTTSTTGGFGGTSSTGTFGCTPPTGGFGGTSTTGGFGGTSTAGGFGGTSTAGGFGSATAAGTTGTGLFSGFGQTNPMTTGGGLAGFGTSFGAKPTTSLGWGGTFGQPQTGLSTFGQTQFQQPQQQQQLQLQQQQQQQRVLDPNQALYNSVFNCQVFGDERDRTLSRWNLVQALWGTGTGFYCRQAPPVDYDFKNPLCRFKATSYSLRPRTENKDGLVALIFNKKETEMRALESQLISNLNNILGNKPNLALAIESIKPFSDCKSIVIIYVQEKTDTGTVRKITASELSGFLTQPMQGQQLTNLQVENVYPQVDPGQEQLREYLDNPPQGFDARLWKQAQDDNPVPDKLIPVPLIGFAGVRWRMKCQEQETALHQAFLDKMAEEIADLQRKHTETLAKISEYRLKFSELQHRILKVMIVQEISRKMGLSLLPEEEKLNSRLESVSATVNSAPFKSRLAKLTEAVNSHSRSNKEPQRYRMDSDVTAEIKQFLTMEQSGMTHVIDTIQSDLADLKRIKDGMTRILQRQI